MISEKEKDELYDDMIRISNQIPQSLKALDAFIPDSGLDAVNLEIKRNVVRKPMYDALRKLKLVAEMIRCNKI